MQKPAFGGMFNPDRQSTTNSPKTNAPNGWHSALTVPSAGDQKYKSERIKQEKSVFAPIKI
jgi:hypothetical protein